MRLGHHGSIGKTRAAPGSASSRRLHVPETVADRAAGAVTHQTADAAHATHAATGIAVVDAAAVVTDQATCVGVARHADAGIDVADAAEVVAHQSAREGVSHYDTAGVDIADAAEVVAHQCSDISATPHTGTNQANVLRHAARSELAQQTHERARGLIDFQPGDRMIAAFQGSGISGDGHEASAAPDVRGVARGRSVDILRQGVVD